MPMTCLETVYDCKQSAHTRAFAIVEAWPTLATTRDVVSVDIRHILHVGANLADALAWAPQQRNVGSEPNLCVQPELMDLVSVA